MMVSKRNLLFWGLLFRFHVEFRGRTCLCVSKKSWVPYISSVPNIYSWEEAVFLSFVFVSKYPFFGPVWYKKHHPKFVNAVYVHPPFLVDPTLVDPSFFFPKLIRWCPQVRNVYIHVPSLPLECGQFVSHNVGTVDDLKMEHLADDWNFNCYLQECFLIVPLRCVF